MMMRIVRSLIAMSSLVLVGCQGGERVEISDDDGISLKVVNSLAIPAHRVDIRLTMSGHLELEQANKAEAPQAVSLSVGADDVEKVRTLVRGIRWKRVARDEVIGLDGTQVSIGFNGRDYSVWTPSHDTRKRGLEDYLQLKAELFRLAGLNEQQTSE